MKVRVYAVSEIVGYIKELIERDVLLAGFFMEGEISNCKRHSSGHVYFTLKDGRAAINAVMFRGHAQDLAFVPEDGMKVIAYGRVSVYEKTGQAQLYAELLEPMGKGGLFAAFEQLKAKLTAEGLFDSARKRPLPAQPKCVAVITSPTGAAVRDIITVLHRRSPGTSIVVVPVLVQGKDAGADIARGLADANRWGKADVILLGRGGGSAEDLWAFNEECVARAIAKSKIPVVSAVGHETDFTIADFAADVRAATPSAAAELITQDIETLRQRAKTAAKRLGLALLSRLAYARASFAQAQNDISKAMTAALRIKRARLDYTLNGLHKLSPLHVLQRGYAAATGAGGTAVSSVRQLETGMAVHLTFADGEAGAVIGTITPNRLGSKANG